MIKGYLPRKKKEVNSPAIRPSNGWKKRSGCKKCKWGAATEPFASEIFIKMRRINISPDEKPLKLVAGGFGGTRKAFSPAGKCEKEGVYGRVNIKMEASSLNERQTNRLTEKGAKSGPRRATERPLPTPPSAKLFYRRFTGLSFCQKRWKSIQPLPDGL